jgi:hypothetical protein
MELVKVPQEVAIQNVDQQSSVVMELLDQYEISVFVDAVEASRFDRAFRKNFKVSFGDDLFWDDVKVRLKHSVAG